VSSLQSPDWAASPWSASRIWRMSAARRNRLNSRLKHNDILINNKITWNRISFLIRKVFIFQVKYYAQMQADTLEIFAY
jgi:hypothetical protein